MDYHCPAHYVIGPFRDYSDCPFCAPPEQMCRCYCFCTSYRVIGQDYCEDCLRLCQEPLDWTGQVCYNAKSSQE